MWSMRRDSAWNLAAPAMTLPLFLGCAGLGWQWVLLGGTGAAVLLWLLPGAGKGQIYGKGQAAWNVCLRFSAALTALVLAPLCAWVCRLSAAVFPQTAQSPIAALLILALAAAGALLGPKKLGRCAAVLCRFILLLLAAVLLFSAPQIRWANLRPAGRPSEALTAFFLLLTPALQFRLPNLDGRTLRLRHTLCLPVLGALVSALTAGVLSPAIARRPLAFAALAQSVSVLGVMRRFEALAYAGLLMGGFCLAGLLLCCLRESLRRACPRRAKPLFFFALSTAAALCFVQKDPDPARLLAFGATFCVFLPELVQAVVSEKSLRKIKKMLDK